MDTQAIVCKSLMASNESVIGTKEMSAEAWRRRKVEKRRNDHVISAGMEVRRMVETGL